MKNFTFKGAIRLVNNNELIQTHDTAYPIPSTLTPSYFPKEDYQFALDIQCAFNELCFRISNDYEFLKATLHK